MRVIEKHDWCWIKTDLVVNGKYAGDFTVHGKFDYLDKFFVYDFNAGWHEIEATWVEYDVDLPNSKFKEKPVLEQVLTISFFCAANFISEMEHEE